MQEAAVWSFGDEARIYLPAVAGQPLTMTSRRRRTCGTGHRLAMTTVRHRSVSSALQTVRRRRCRSTGSRPLPPAVRRRSMCPDIAPPRDFFAHVTGEST